MHIPQRDIATAAAADLALASLQKVLSDTKSSNKLIQSALIPIFGIRWGAQVIRRMEGKLRGILRKLRNSNLDSETYRRVSLLWHTAGEAETDFPHAWTEWRATIERFNLGDELELSEWIDVIDAFINLGWDSPSKLALIPSSPA